MIQSFIQAIRVLDWILRDGQYLIHSLTIYTTICRIISSDDTLFYILRIIFGYSEITSKRLVSIKLRRLNENSIE